MSIPADDGINGIGFIVNDRPIAVYGPNLRKNTREFVQSFDVSFWTHQLELASAIPVEEATHDHVGFLRLILAHSQEHLFALIFAALQAPFCPDLWLYRYAPSDLPKMTERVLRGGHILNRFKLKEATWLSISKTFWPGLDDRRYDLTAKVLDRLAKHFVSDFTKDEYNGIKHGLRPSFGGHSVSFSPCASPDKKPDPDSFVSLGSSSFGCRFYGKFKPLPGSNNQFRALRRFSNWHIEVILHQVHHTVMLIENMGIPLRIFSDVDGDRTFKFFNKDDEYEMDPSQEDKFFQMEETFEFDIAASKRIDLGKVKDSYT